MAGNDLFRSTILKYLYQNYLEFRTLGLSSSAIAKRAHLWTAPAVRDIVVRAHATFGGSADRKSCARAMIDTVIRGVHPTFDALLEARASASARADELFGANPDTAAVKGSPITIAVRRLKCTIDRSYQRYTQALRDGLAIADHDPAFGGVVRTMAGWVMDDRFQNMLEGYTYYRSIHEQVTKLLLQRGEADAKLTGTATILILKGTYQTPEKAVQAWQGRA